MADAAPEGGDPRVVVALWSPRPSAPHEAVDRVLGALDRVPDVRPEAVHVAQPDLEHPMADPGGPSLVVTLACPEAGAAPAAASALARLAGTAAVQAWRVRTHRHRRYERSWAPGEPSPGIKQLAFLRPAPGVGPAAFRHRYVVGHTPLVERHHVGFWAYAQNVVEEPLTEGGREVLGISEIHLRHEVDLRERYLDSEEGRRVILADVRAWLRLDRPASVFTTEVLLG